LLAHVAGERGDAEQVLVVVEHVLGSVLCYLEWRFTFLGGLVDPELALVDDSGGNVVSTGTPVESVSFAKVLVAVLEAPWVISCSLELGELKTAVALESGLMALRAMVADRYNEAIYAF
jgi:hypothetical protein